MKLIKYLGKKFYSGRHIKWLIATKQGGPVSCDRCGNYANGIKIMQMLFFKINVPLCKKHIAEDYLKGDKIIAPHIDLSELREERYANIKKMANAGTLNELLSKPKPDIHLDGSIHADGKQIDYVRR